MHAGLYAQPLHSLVVLRVILPVAARVYTPHRSPCTISSLFFAKAAIWLRFKVSIA